MQIEVVVYPAVERFGMVLQPTDCIQVILDKIFERHPEYQNQRVRLLHQGQPLNPLVTAESVGIHPNSLIHSVVAPRFESSRSEPASDGRDEALEVRAGLYAFLDAGIDRESVIGNRLSLLINGGYLNGNQIRVFYNNNFMVPPPHVAPAGADELRGFVELALHDAPAPGPAPAAGDTSAAAALEWVRPLFGRQEVLADDAPPGPIEFIADFPFTLLMMEGGFPDYVRATLLPSFPPCLQRLYGAEPMCDDMDELRRQLPLPPVPARALQLEARWVSMRDNSAPVSVNALGQEHDLLGPGTPIEANPVQMFSTFRFLVEFTVGLLAGFFLHIIAFPACLHSHVRGAVQLGVLTGILTNMVFSVFIQVSVYF